MTFTLSKSQIVGLLVIALGLAVAFVPLPNVPWIGPPPPIPQEGLRVLFVDESKASKLGNVFADKELTAYLDSHCAKGTDPKQTPEWRVFDPDRDTTYDPPIWQNVLKRPRTSLPWIVCSNGKTGFEGACPEEPAMVLEIIKPYGGP